MNANEMQSIDEIDKWLIMWKLIDQNKQSLWKKVASKKSESKQDALAKEPSKREWWTHDGKNDKT